MKELLVKIKSASATATLHDTLGRAFTMSVDGPDEASALELLKCKLKLIKADRIEKIRISIELADKEIANLEVDHTEGKVSGHRLVLRLMHPDKPRENFFVRLEHASDKFANKLPYWHDGKYQLRDHIKHPDLLAFVEAYRDKEGKGGYFLAEAYYTKD